MNDSSEKIKKAVLYSSKHGGFTHAKQLAVCSEYALGKGYEVLTEFSDSKTGKASLEDRPQLQRAMLLAPKNSDTVLVVHHVAVFSLDPQTIADSLERINMESVLDKCNTFSTVGRATIGMFALFAQVSQTIDAVSGPPRGPKPLWTKRRDDVSRIRELYGTGDFTIVSLAEHLNNLGIPGPRGGKWHPTSVRRILTTRVPDLLPST